MPYAAGYVNRNLNILSFFSKLFFTKKITDWRYYPFSFKKEYKNYLNKDHNFDKETIIGIFCLVIVITGIFGWLYEFIFYYFNGGMKEFYWRGGNFLPWINIYATGSIMIYLLTYKHRKKPWKVFLLSFFSTITSPSNSLTEKNLFNSSSLYNVLSFNKSYSS